MRLAAPMPEEGVEDDEAVAYEYINVSSDVEASKDAGLLQVSGLRPRSCPGRLLRSCSWRRCLVPLACAAGIGSFLLYRRFSPEALPRGYCEAASAPFPEAPLPSDERGLASWAKRLVAEMTRDEKMRLLRGMGWSAGVTAENYYIGDVLGIPRLGLPAINMQDAMQGFRTSDWRMVGQVTSFPCALALASTWDAEATEQWATAIGEEFRAKGASVVLGPSVNVHRTPYGGRNAEYLSGEDPWLGRALAPAYVRGLQERAGVASVMKHFAFNQQETDRSTVDVHVDERTRFEQYYPPYQAAIRAGVAATMCAYNYVNGKQACSDEQGLTEELKGLMGFSGFVMSDWYALQNGEGPAAGTDLDMPGDDGLYSDAALSAQPPARVDHMAASVLRGMGRSRAWREAAVGVSCRAGCNCSSLLYETSVTTRSHRALARRLAAEGAVLLKNEGQAEGSPPPLPFRPGQRVAVVGAACDAGPLEEGRFTSWTAADYYSVGGSGRVLSNRSTSILDGLKSYPDLALQVSATDRLDEAQRALNDADVMLTCGGATTSEFYDRSTLNLEQDDTIELLLAMAAERGVPSVVVALSPGPLVLPWLDSAAAVLTLFLSGEATGLAAGDLLAGAVSPSGKLPVTFPLSEADAVQPCSKSPCKYTEGLRGGWHLYDHKPVAFPFGHGLSYTSFGYTVVEEWAPSILRREGGASGGDGKTTATWEIAVGVTNTGSRAKGAEVVQLFLRFPEGDNARPDLQLRSFARTPALAPGEQHVARLRVSAEDLSRWDEASHSWKLVPGRFETFVAASSRDLRLCGAFLLRSGSGQSPVLGGVDGGILTVAEPTMACSASSGSSSDAQRLVA